nr:reverse transcriptase domain-containing protein [Tanacetum cinerariifolium]
MHAYYAKESPIPPLIIMPPSPMLSPMFNPQEFFLPEELLPPKKHGRDRSSSSTPTLPQEFEIREISRLGKGRVIIQQDFDNLETELQETHAQVAKLQRKQLGQNNKIALACFKINDLKQIIKEIKARHQADYETLEVQAAYMENADHTNRNHKPREAHVARKCSYKEFMSSQTFNFKGSEGAIGLIYWFECTKLVFSCSKCTKDCKVKFATGTLTKEALSWWNSFAQPIRIKEAYKLSLVEFKKLLIKKRPYTVKCNTCNKVDHMTEDCRNKGQATRSILLPLTILVMPVEKKGIMQISAERPPTTMPREELTC